MRVRQTEYEVGDIVYVSEYEYKDGARGENHLFVVINVDKNELIPMEYFGMLVSSQRQKSKENSEFKYNEPLDINPTNGLKKDSIVKCEQVYSIPPTNIQFKIGAIDVDDYMRFMDAYNTFLKELEEELNRNQEQ